MLYLMLARHFEVDRYAVPSFLYMMYIASYTACICNILYVICITSYV